MLEEDILELLTVKKTLDELQAELKVNKKKLRNKLKSMVHEGVVECDDGYYRKNKEPVKTINYLPLAVLAVIILFGFYLRVYHIDYPVVGYHNWKEEHYLGEARSFARDGFFRHGFFVPAWDYPSIKSDPSGVHADTLPTISILAGLAFMFFGCELWIARLIGILLNTAVIPLTYLVVKKIFGREDIALVSAFLTALNPLLVFFSHNVQLINVGVSCSLASLYFFLLWRESGRGWNLILTSFFFALAGLTKYPFMAIAAPMFFMFPFSRLRDVGRNLVPYVVSALILTSIPAWMYYSSVVVMEEYEAAGSATGFGAIQPAKIFSEQFLKTTESYMRDSFTLLGVGFAVLGLIAAAISYLLDRKPTLARRFMWGSLVGIIGFVLITSSKLLGHSYYYYVVAPFVIVFMSYFIVAAGDSVKKLRVDGKSIGGVNWVVIVVLVLILVPASQESASRQFDTQFFGLDVAGDYLKEHKNPGERVMHSSHQAFGLLWHADMMGTRGIPSTVEDIRFAEEKLNASWLFIYNWDFRGLMDDTERWGYIVNNYRLVQAGFIQTRDGRQLVYLLLRKGGTFSMEELNNLSVNKVRYRDYELTGNRPVKMGYIDIE